MKKKNSNLSTILLVVMFFVGLCLLLYPSLSDYYNSFHQSRVIARYAETIADMGNEEYQRVLAEARAYNEEIAAQSPHWILSEEERKVYNGVMNISGIGIMGYIEIPKIECSLPIYHGTSDTVLQIAIGHIEGSSIPIGGPGTHAVLSGHRGLPSAKLFTNLDKLQEGDTFVIRVLDETMTYAVDEVLIVEPNDLSRLSIQAGKDLVTLVTCTPYGINTHRLLVQGHRVENQIEDLDIRVTADALQIEPIIVAPLMAIPLLLLLIIGVLFSTGRKKVNVTELLSKENRSK